MVEKSTNLFKTICQDNAQQVKITNYSDMVIYSSTKQLVAVRFGGYPESVQAMSDAIRAGCSLILVAPGGRSQIALSSKEGFKYTHHLSHDGLYAESLCYLGDERLQISDEQDQKRNLYIFCENESDLFVELDRRLSVPLLPEFETYFLAELKRRGLLKQLQVRTSHEIPIFAWHLAVSNAETEVIAILDDGLKDGSIHIPNSSKLYGPFGKIETFSSYLKEFGTQLCEKIKQSFIPQFNPTKEPVSNRIKQIGAFVKSNCHYELFDAQLAAAEALKRQLDHHYLALLVAECGTGKTKIASAALYAHQHSKMGKNCFNVVICPSHITEKWVREIVETIPNSYAYVANTIRDIDLLYDIYLEGKLDVYCILSKEKARNGAMKYPAVRWSDSKKGYLCPHCGTVQEMPILEDGSRYVVNADDSFYRVENGRNHKCQNPECSEPLWSCINPEDWARPNTEWIRIGGYGYIRRDKVNRIEPSGNLAIDKKISAVTQNPHSIYLPTGAYRRYPLSRYIKKHLGHIDALICDELHQYSGESAQGEAMADLAGIAKKVIGMTATLINGYAKGMFYLLYRLNPSLMLLDNKQYTDTKPFCNEYGVTETTYVIKHDQYNVSSRCHKQKVKERFLPGVSPLVYTRFLLDNCAFLSLADMGKELPEYEEIPLGCMMPASIKAEYERLEKEFKQLVREDRKFGTRLLSANLHLLTAYPDQPYGQPVVRHPKTHKPLIEPAELSSIDNVLPKDELVLQIVDSKVKTGGRVIIYTSWTRLDTQEKLGTLLKNHGYQVSILDRKIPTAKRESWVDKQVQSGVDVLLVNPALVETGLDLNAFTTLIFYNLAYNLYIFRQASRRSWRINQSASRVEVYMLYYYHTIQERALKLMASKLAAATVIEGNISDEGLAALSDCQDMTTELARELVQGIQNNATSVDLVSSFKKMAVLHDTEKAQPASAALIPLKSLASTTQSKKPKSNNKNRFTTEETGQLDLFELLVS